MIIDKEVISIMKKLGLDYDKIKHAEMDADLIYLTENHSLTDILKCLEDNNYIESANDSLKMILITLAI